MNIAAPASPAPSARHPRSRKRGAVRTFIWFAVVIVLTAVVLYPVLWIVGTSFKPNSEFGSNPGLFPNQPTLDNYIHVAQGIAGIPLWRFFWNSFFVTSIAVLGTVLSSALAAYAFARIRFRGSKVIFGVVIATLLLPTHVVIIPQYILFSELGMLDTYWPLFLPRFLATEAFFVFLLVQFIRQLPRETDEAAIIDGAGHFRVFWSITLPLIRPALITVAILTFIGVWNDFLSPLLYLSSPDLYTLPIALRLYNDETTVSNYGASVAVSLLAIIPVLLFFLVFQRFFVSGMATQGLKG